MRIAALYDVHGNLPALEAVLEEIEADGVDEIVVGGDVMWGPLQAQCIERLRSVGATFVAGNCEWDALNGTSDTERWCREQLDDETRDFVASWPLTVERTISTLGRVLFCHATPQSDRTIVTTLTPDDAIRETFAGVEADVVVCGHTHVQFDRSASGAPRLVNAGSVGLAYQGAPGAYWTIVGPAVEPRRTVYDVERALTQLAPAGFPPFDDVFPRAMRGLVTAEEAAESFESRRGA